MGYRYLWVERERVDQVYSSLCPFFWRIFFFLFAVVVLLHMALLLVGDGVGVKLRVMLVAGLFSNIDALTLPFR